MRSYLLFSLILLLNFSCQQHVEKTTIAFGSCSHEFDSAQMWDHVITHKPAAWVWLGDNIYGDTRDMELMRKKYQQQKTRASYQQLLASTKVFGTWDDHDFGINDGGKEFDKKDESKMLMLEFLDVPKSHEVWQRDGVYQSYIIEEAGLSIKVILLDTRYFRDSLLPNPDAPPRYFANENGTILGKTQWTWLENELSNSSADIHLICSSIQLIPIEQDFEKWGNFPKERERFFHLIEETKPARPIVLSGDRHIAEFSKIELDGLDYPLYEFTSSGLTHTWGKKWLEKNQYRIGELMIKKNFGTIEISQSRDSINIELKVFDDQNKMIASTTALF